MNTSHHMIDSVVCSLQLHVYRAVALVAIGMQHSHERSDFMLRFVSVNQVGN